MLCVDGLYDLHNLVDHDLSEAYGTFETRSEDVHRNLPSRRERIVSDSENALRRRLFDERRMHFVAGLGHYPNP